MTLCVWLRSLGVFSKFLHVVACVSPSFLLRARYYSAVGTDHVLSLQSSADGHLAGFHVSSIVKKAAMNITFSSGWYEGKRGGSSWDEWGRKRRIKNLWGRACLRPVPGGSWAHLRGGGQLLGLPRSPAPHCANKDQNRLPPSSALSRTTQIWYKKWEATEGLELEHLS